jgi:hypothetical protein
MNRRFPIGAIGVALFGISAVGCSTAESSEDAPAVTAQAGSSAAPETGFVGNWELVSFESFRESGEVVDNDYVGRLVYDDRGNMSAVGMPRTLVDRAAAAGDEMPRAGFAYFSTYDVHPEAATVVHHVIGSPMNPTWVGTDLVRYFQFEEGLLKLSLRNDQGRVTGTLTWRKLEAAATDQI